MTEPEFAIEAIGLEKIYRGSGKLPEMRALKGIDLKIRRGSMFGLLGPNGAGKSTFINILAGLVTKTSGTAKIWGLDIDKHPRTSRAAIGVVNQEITMDPFFTPIQALELQAGYYGVPKKDRRSMEILTAVGLDDKKDAYVRQLSGGMKRRLMVAKALVHNPPVLILDEPTAGVDVELRRSLWAYVRELHANGTTIILTTHYLEEAEEMCDQIAIINHGEVVARDSTANLLGMLDARTLVVQPQNPVSQAPSAQGIDGELRADGSLAFTYRSGVTQAEAVLDMVRAAGISIRDLRSEEPHLQDVFLALTSSKSDFDAKSG